jgi:DNA-binding MarR family transcriptional regulator
MTQAEASAPKQPRPRSSAADCPWKDLDEAGTGLSVDDFLTTVVSRAANALRRAITVPYAERAGLTVSEWRMLSVLAHARQMSFSELVVQAVADKAQVSRALRLMEERGLVKMEKTGSNPRWQQIDCKVTPEGMALYRKVMPMARRRQAAMIRKLSPADRVATYRALKLLREIAGESAAEDALE